MRTAKLPRSPEKEIKGKKESAGNYLGEPIETIWEKMGLITRMLQHDGL